MYTHVHIYISISVIVITSFLLSLLNLRVIASYPNYLIRLMYHNQYKDQFFLLHLNKY